MIASGKNHYYFGVEKAMGMCGLLPDSLIFVPGLRAMIERYVRPVRVAERTVVVMRT